MSHQARRERLHEKCSKQVHPQGRRNPPHHHNRRESGKAPETERCRDVDSVFDASFIKAWSTRDPLDSQTGYSDREARVGRAGRSFGLGYKLHLAIDSKTMLPLACSFASANQNEQKHSLNMLEKTKLTLKRSAAKLKRVNADSQYSDGKLRGAVEETAIPYRANQKREVKGLLRVDRKFRTYGPDEQKKEYHKRPHIEAVNSFLKTQYSMAINKVRGLGNVASYALFSILCLVLNREAPRTLEESTKQCHRPTLTRNIGTRQCVYEFC